jgi:esterase/lipase
MAEVLLFHHAQGLTAGVLAFADALRAAGHTVHTPDLFDGRTFGSIDEGLAYAKEVGFEDVLERGVRMADDLPSELVYAGFSLGEMAAQKLAQTRPGARRSGHCPCRGSGRGRRPAKARRTTRR